MKNAILILLLFTGNQLFSQQIQNAGFESWEVENGKAEPNNWSSIQTGDPAALAGLAPQVIFESTTEAHTGSKSIKMENKSAFGIVANGIVTTGKIFASVTASDAYVFTDVNDARWNSPVNARPDSLVGWYKYQPMGADKPGVVALLHTGTGKIPDLDSTNYVGHCKLTLPNTTVSTWTRFSVPFYYMNGTTPEYILLSLTSGDETNAVEGSIAFFDDIELIYNPVGISSVESYNSIKTYGGINQINIDLSSLSYQEKWHAAIYDITGKEYLQQDVTAGDITKINSVKPGVYICVLSNGDQTVTKKIVVQ